MKSKASRDFRQIRIKIFLQTVSMLAMSAAAVYFIYSFLLRGNFAGGMVSLFQALFGMGYTESLDLYQKTFRRHMDMLILLSMALVFLGLLQVYLRWFTGYFEKIGMGMDKLLRDTPGEISLPPELFSIERKMNGIKRMTERQKNEMLISEQRKNDLVMYLAHDLKTPLASSISYLNLLRDEREISEELREKYVSISLSKAERLEQLINEFLEIAKYNLSGVTLQYSGINLTRFLEQLIYEFKPILDQKGLTCRLEAEKEIALTCDADKMQRVFDNLLHNAVMYSYDGSEIAITAGKSGDNLVLTFSNQGDTIPKEKLDRIFEQFYRLDPGRSTEGTGLGLAIARQIVVLHRGTVTAASENGRTVFTITLPAGNV